MENNLTLTNNSLEYEKITIISLEKLDNGYMHIMGIDCFKRKIDVITNGILTFDFNLFNKVKNIIKFNKHDYLIAETYFGKTHLISLNDGKTLMKSKNRITYLEDGLFNINGHVFDLEINDYISFPDNMDFRSYKNGYIVLKDGNKETYDPHKEMVIDRNGNIIVPKIDGNITLLNENKFITNNMIIDFNNKIIIKDADLVMPLIDDKIMVLKNRKIFVLNNLLEIIKTYNIGENKKPWYVSIRDDAIIMSFKKKTHTKKHEPRIETSVTVIINTKTDEISKMDILPSMSNEDIFKITNEHHKVGLMNKKYEIVFKTEWDSIKELHDTENKYFFIEKDNKYYIFNYQTGFMLEVLYEEMKEFHDGLAICYNPAEENIQLIDENLNPVFNLERLGYPSFFYKNGILCYHSGNYDNDEYTIITEDGKVLMPSRKCRVKRNDFDILEIHDYKTDEIILFDLNNGSFFELEINVPIIETEKGETLDFSKIPIQQLISKSCLFLESDESSIKKMLLKSKLNDELN